VKQHKPHIQNSSKKVEPRRDRDYEFTTLVDIIEEKQVTITKFFGLIKSTNLIPNVIHPNAKLKWWCADISKISCCKPLVSSDGSITQQLSVLFHPDVGQITVTLPYTKLVKLLQSVNRESPSFSRRMGYNSDPSKASR